MTEDLHTHPAVKAWRRARPDDAEPTCVETVVKEPSNATFRLGYFEESGPVIAKRRSRACLEPELVIYQTVLPLLPIPPVRCLGVVADDDPERAWLFVEDVGGDPYDEEHPDHRALAGRWLAAVHSSGMQPSVQPRLPDRGPSHYLSALHTASTEIEAHVDRTGFDVEDRRILFGVLRALAELEARWHVIESWCDAMPRTLVHGDFVPKNCRVRPTADGEVGLVVFDWETAGWGVPAVDLATNVFCRRRVALDQRAYVTAMRHAWPGLDERDVVHIARIGDAQRVVAATEWTCQTLTYDWIVQSELRFYLPHLEKAVRLVGGTVAAGRLQAAGVCS